VSYPPPIDVDPSAPRTVVLADDPLVREGISGVLASVGIEVVLDAADADVALLDAGSDADRAEERLEAIEDIAAPVVALVPSADLARVAVALGARGVVERRVDATRLEAALRAVRAGLAIVDAAFTDTLLLVESEPETPPTDLTAREREVLELLAAGLSNRAIGERLSISEHTAKFHVNAIRQKLGASTRTEAVVRAARLGLILL
jgi:DNA-binding NarL/FixJ family response regulator